MADDQYTDILDTSIGNGEHDLHDNRWQWWKSEWDAFWHPVLYVGIASAALTTVTIFLSAIGGIFPLLLVLASCVTASFFGYGIVRLICSLFYLIGYTIDTLTNRGQYISISGKLHRGVMYFSMLVPVSLPVYFLYVMWFQNKSLTRSLEFW